MSLRQYKPLWSYLAALDETLLAWKTKQQECLATYEALDNHNTGTGAKWAADVYGEVIEDTELMIRGLRRALKTKITPASNRLLRTLFELVGDDSTTVVTLSKLSRHRYSRDGLERWSTIRRIGNDLETLGLFRWNQLIRGFSLTYAGYRLAKTLEPLPVPNPLPNQRSS